MDEERRGSDPRWSRGRGEPVQQPRSTQAGIPRAALRVQDLEIRPPSRWPVAVARDGGLAALPHHVPPEADPARSPQLQPQAARLFHGRGQRPAQGVRLQHDDQRPRASRHGGEPAQSVPHPLPGDRGIPPVRQVQHQQVHGPGGEERPGQRERLLDVRGRQDHEPFRADAARDGLHGIERPRQVQPRDDRPTGLRLRGQPQRHRGLARGGVPTQRDRGGTGQAARAEDRVQRGEPGGDDTPVQVRGGGRRGCDRVPDRLLERHRLPCECPLDHPRELAPTPRSGRAPASLERGKSLGDVGCASHRTPNNRTNVLVVKESGNPSLRDGCRSHSLPELAGRGGPRSRRSETAVRHRDGGPAGPISRATLPGRSTRRVGADPVGM